MYALVTGASGFLGRYIVEQLLARGDRVRAVIRRPQAAVEQLGVEIVRADLRDRAATIATCAGVDAVFHVAGVAGIWGPWRYYYEANTLATEHVVAGCRTHGVGRLVYTSSPSVTFSGGDQSGIDESVPYPKRWLCHYPHSKALAEQAVLAANGGNLRTCALRPHLIWGPRDEQLVPRLWRRALAGKLRRVGSGQNLIDTIYVENAAEVHLLAADALAAGRGAGQAYFISQGEPVRCWPWIDELLAVAGLPPVRRGISNRAAWWLGLGLEGVWHLTRRKDEPPMTRFLAAQLGHDHYFRIDNAKRDLGYAPRIDMAEGMRRLAAWAPECVAAIRRSG